MGYLRSMNIKSRAIYPGPPIISSVSTGPRNQIAWYLIGKLTGTDDKNHRQTNIIFTSTDSDIHHQ